MSRIKRDLIGQMTQPHMDGAISLKRKMRRQVRTEKIGACDGSDHDRAAREQRQLLALRVQQHVTQGMRGMPGRMACQQSESPDSELLPLINRLEVEFQAGACGCGYNGSGFGAQLARAGDEVVVDMSLKGSDHPHVQGVGSD